MSPEIMRGPVSPNEVEALRTEMIPDEVFNVFNQQIAQNLHNGRAKVLQKNVVAALEAQGLPREYVYENHWLDVEESYRAVGWRVEYDRPVYYAGEDFDAFFEFKAPGQNW